MVTTSRFGFRVLLTLAMLAGLLLAAPLQAAAPPDHLVTTTFDSGEGSLRAAIAAAQDGEKIAFDLDNYPRTITLESRLSIERDLTIVGPGADMLTISGDNDSQVLAVHLDATVTISGVALKEGKVEGHPAGGGAVTNAGTLTLREVVVSDSRTLGDSAGALAMGGGIYNVGTLLLEDSTIESNRAEGGDDPAGLGGGALGGGICSLGALTLVGTTIDGNVAQAGDGDAGGQAQGGGVYDRGVETLSIRAGSVLSNNSALAGEGSDDGGYAYGGGLSVEPPSLVGAGGSISAGSGTIEDSTLRGNTARGGDGAEDGEAGRGGGIYNSYSFTLTVSASQVVSNTAQGGEGAFGDGGDGRGGGIENHGTLIVEASAILSNTVQGGSGLDRPGGDAGGGGIHNTEVLTIEASALSGNSVRGGDSTNDRGGYARGGGIRNVDRATVEASTLSNNSLRGGDSTNNQGGHASGGGTWSSWRLMVEASTLGSNTAQGGAGNTADGAANGGGHSAVLGVDPSISTFLNCTISGNEAISGEAGHGGGLYAGNLTTVTLSFCTIADNGASHEGGGLWSYAPEKGTGPMLKNTIIGDNRAPLGPTIYGRAQSRDFNLIQDTIDALVQVSGDGNSGDSNLFGPPRLGPLQDNGGPPTGSGEPPWTHALLGGANPSKAIDAGSDTDIDNNPVDVDQRGFSRPYPPVAPGDKHDMGAYEWSGVDLVVVKSVSPAEARPGQAITYRLTFSNAGLEIATGVVLTDRVPNGVMVSGVMSASVPPASDWITDTGYSPAYVWQVRDLASGEGGVITISGLLDASLELGELENTATISAHDRDSDAGNGSSTAVVRVRGLRVYLPVVLREK